MKNLTIFDSAVYTLGIIVVVWGFSKGDQFAILGGLMSIMMVGHIRLERRVTAGLEDTEVMSRGISSACSCTSRTQRSCKHEGDDQ